MDFVPNAEIPRPVEDSGSKSFMILSARRVKRFSPVRKNLSEESPHLVTTFRGTMYPRERVLIRK